MIRNILFLILFSTPFFATAQQSVARRWNNVQLEAIRQDFARPPVQARNLFHASLAMWDAWAAYQVGTSTYVLGQQINGVTYPFPFAAPIINNNLQESQEMALSYAMYRLLRHRYANSPMVSMAYYRFDTLMSNLGYPTNITSTNYANATPAEFGNYIASKVIDMGLADGSRESTNHNNANYYPFNSFLNVGASGAPLFTDFNHWQPLFITTAVDQNNNPIGSNQVALCPEWGRVVPFALTPSNKTMYSRFSTPFPVYHDCGAPPALDTAVGLDSASTMYKWGNTLVVSWASHLSPNDTTMIDISPAAKGNIQTLPTTFSDYLNFYKFQEGGDTGTGHLLNPITNMPYANQWVKRGDYTRIVSQYWADGPSSETPPGHWFALFNEVADNPLCTKKMNGVGTPLSNLEWDVKGYFTLGGAMHDAAITAWSLKGYYDSPRPISAIRKLAELGQCSDSTLPHYHKAGLPLIPGLIELILPGDPMLMGNPYIANRIKIKAWRGFNYINNPSTDVGDVGWIMAENWVPYQRKSFVTPPFAGYVSGHSTYSRAAAEAMTLLTGDEYFPGGLHETQIAANSNYLGFENGPSAPINLQWATYRDASNESSLSRIWGGIHGPIDDINGRIVGAQIGIAAFNKATTYFNASSPLATTIQSFTAKENNCVAQLNWHATDEQNIQSYQIWKSTKLGSDYIKIADIRASQQQNYSWADEALQNSNYYRLIIQDNQQNTQTTFLNFIDGSKCGNANQLGLQVFPNPASDLMTATIQSHQPNEQVSLCIKDIYGKTIFCQKQILANIENKVSIPIASYASGNYLLQCTFEDGQVVGHQFVIAH
jgi:Secretion system C-terminal sorting domain